MAKFDKQDPLQQSAGVPRVLLALALFAVALVAGGCSSDATEPAPATPVVTPPPAAPSRCAEGFVEDGDGACLDVQGPASCAPGTRPRLGSSTCEPVGWADACPTGTTRDASGFGCIDPAPPSACTGASREAYGSASCVTIGDCNAPFPPVGAIVVDAALLDAQLDATHVRTLTEGVAAATAAGDGAVVAVETGTYTEGVVVTKRASIVGRCAAKVEIRGPVGTTRPGIDVKATGVVVRGLTLTGHVDGIAVARSAQADIEDVVVRGAKFAGLYFEGGRAAVRRSKIEDAVATDDNRGGYGVATVSGAEATLDDVTITGGAQGTYSSGLGTLTALARVVVTRQAPQPSASLRPAGLTVVAGARAAMMRSVIRDLEGDGAAVVEADGTAELTETIVRNVRVSGSAARGYGLVATFGGHVIARGSMLSEIESNAVLTRDEGSTVALTTTSVLGPTPKGPPMGELKNDSKGAGVSVLMKAKGTMDGVAVIGAWGFGVYADSGATLDVKRSFVDATRAPQGADRALAFAIGLTVNNDAAASVSDLTVTRSSQSGVVCGKKGRLRGERLLVRDVVEGVTDSSGFGVSVGAGGDVELDASAVDLATSSGVFVTQGAASRLRLTRSAVHRTRKGRDGYGHGVTVRLDARVLLESSSLADNAGIGVAADGGRAVLTDTTIARNAVGIHAQGGSFLAETDDADVETLADGEVRVGTSTRFVSNETRVGCGTVALPSPIALP